MGEVLVGFPVYSAHSCPGGLFTTRCVTKSNTGQLQCLMRKAEAASCTTLGRDQAGRQTQLPQFCSSLHFLLSQMPLEAHMGFLPVLPSSQEHPKQRADKMERSQPLLPQRPKNRPGFVEPFLWHRGAGCRLRDFHVLLGPCFHRIYLELLHHLHAHIHGRAGALLHGRARVLGATAEIKFYILAQKLLCEPRAKEIKGTS